MWQPEEESIIRENLTQLQLARLDKTLHRANHIEFYNKKFRESKININKIRTLDDLEKLPFTSKDDLRDNYPYGFFAVDLKEIIRLHASSGTTGKPVVVGYTKKDIEIWKNLIARILVAGGVSEDDIVQIAFTYGLFTGGFGLHYGAEHLGASVIPVSSGNTKRQIMIMKDYKSTVLVCTPTYALHISEIMEEEGVTLDQLSLKYTLLGAERCSDELRDLIEKRLGVIATDNYGLSEIMGPGIAGECSNKNGLHVNEDHFYVEIIDPETGERLPDGERGELVITTLTKEAMPLIRYRTRDITTLYGDKCPCGRTFKKIEKISGRTDDMFIVNGVNIFPSQVEEVLYGINLISNHYMIYLKKKGFLDEMEVDIEVNERTFYDEMKKQKALLDLITDKIFTILGIKPKIKLVAPKSIERFTGKSKRVIDLRNNNI